MTGLADKAGHRTRLKASGDQKEGRQGQLAASMVPWHAKSTGIKELLMCCRHAGRPVQNNQMHSSQWPIAWFLFVSVPVIYSLFFVKCTIFGYSTTDS